MAGPAGRVGQISDVVDAILYLERATFLTGETLHIDGVSGTSAGARVQDAPGGERDEHPRVGGRASQVVAL